MFQITLISGDCDGQSSQSNSFLFFQPVVNWEAVHWGIAILENKLRISKRFCNDWPYILINSFDIISRVHIFIYNKCFHSWSYHISQKHSTLHLIAAMLTKTLTFFQSWYFPQAHILEIYQHKTFLPICIVFINNNNTGGLKQGGGKLK